MNDDIHWFSGIIFILIVLFVLIQLQFMGVKKEFDKVIKLHEEQNVQIMNIEDKIEIIRMMLSQIKPNVSRETKGGE